MSNGKYRKKYVIWTTAETECLDRLILNSNYKIKTKEAQGKLEQKFPPERSYSSVASKLSERKEFLEKLRKKSSKKT